MSLHGFDLNLLRVLEALLNERSVTRAAKRLGRSQPAVSNSLSRLRKTLNDQLLIPTGKGMVLTPRAEALRSSIRDLLALTDQSLFHEAAFDPTTASGTFHISMPDRLTAAVVPSLLARLHDLAPAMDLHLITAAQLEAITMIEEERTDIALGWFDEVPPHCRAELLREEQLYCVFRRNHPLTKTKFTMDAVLSFPHLAVTARGRTAAIFDDLLMRHGKKRHAHVTVSNFSAVPQLLASSDMIGVFTQLAAGAFLASAKLSKRPLPLNVGTISTSMVWHMRNDRDGRHGWLRDQIKAVYRTL